MKWLRQASAKGQRKNRKTTIGQLRSGTSALFYDQLFVFHSALNII